MPKPKEPKEVRYSLCEGVRASGTSPWHLRRLAEKGMKLGGGIDTNSLCNRVKAPYGWDLNVTITDHHLGHTCQICVEIYQKHLQEMRKGK